jgi:quercetin dioxygenase-like cupin family protein
MSLYYVGKLDESKFATPHGYAGHSRGYRRLALVDNAVGSVHMGVGICELAAGGKTEAHVHANEKGIHILEGEIELKQDRQFVRLVADDFALVPYGMPHAFRNVGNNRARWFEMQAPQPKPPGGWQDTYFEGSVNWPSNIERPDFADPRTRHVGHFSVGKQGTTHNKGGTTGLTVRRFIEREFGAQHFNVMRGEIAPGGFRGYHDHPLEESYLVFSGEAEMEIEGQRFLLSAGSVAWTGVGTAHAFYQRGDAPFRWIETQAPQFPTQNGHRDYVVWEKLGRPDMR